MDLLIAPWLPIAMGLDEQVADPRYPAKVRRNIDFFDLATKSWKAARGPRDVIRKGGKESRQVLRQLKRQSGEKLIRDYFGKRRSRNPSPVACHASARA